MNYAHTNFRRFLLSALLFLVPFFLYGRYFGNPLLFDDVPFFTDQALYEMGHCWFKLNIRLFAYAPLGWAYLLLGNDWFWYRVVNVALHATTCVLIYVFFRRLFRAVIADAQDSSIEWLAFSGALLFAVHPVAVYAVAYLVERSIVLATLFSIASLYAFLEGLLRKRQAWFIAAGALYFLAVFSKEHSVMVPALVLALTLLLRKPEKGLLREIALPFALYAAIGMLIILRAKGVLGASYEPYAQEMLQKLFRGSSENQIEHAYGLSVITQGYLFFKYLVLWLFPNPARMAIDMRADFATHWFSWPESLGFLAFLVWPVVAIWLLRKGGTRGLAGFGMLFPWLLFMTEISTVRLQEPFVLYRSYLWMAGLPALLPFFAAKLNRRAQVLLVLGVGAIFAILAVNRLETFRSGLAVWDDAMHTLSPNSVLGMDRIYTNRGYAYAQQGDDAHALRDYAQALQLNPRFRDALSNRAMALLRLGRYDAALQDIENYIALNRENYLGYLGRGTIYSAQGKFDAALRDFNQAIMLAPTLSDGYLNRSTVYISLGRYDAALTDLDEALRHNPRAAEVYANRGYVNLQLGRPEDAVRDLDWAIKLNPALALSYTNRGLYYAAIGQIEAALADFDRVIKMEPRSARAYFNRGNAFVALGHPKEALADFEQAITLAPKLADAYNNHGALLMMQGDNARALTDFEHAIDANPRNLDAYVNRGGVFMAQSRFKEALQDYDRVLALDAANVRAYLGRGFARLALRDRTGAIQDLRRACSSGAQSACTKLSEIGA